jgi:formylglycine-generating enzyme required for sulfatase activity/tRNA A-37 threonylcarbamoyl transferase component Bud32
VCFGCGRRLRVPDSAQPPDTRNLTFRAGERVSERYVIRELIGSGGMGVVYRAFDTLVNEEVALKFMKPHLLTTKKGQQLFVQEAQVARRLRHENIVAVHDVGTTADGILYISMEFIEGRSLRSLLARHRKQRKLVNVRLAVATIAKVLAALEYAHRTVVHRDIKPENVMLLPAEKVKVLDFGLARAIDFEETAPAGPKKRKRVVGTLAYASPEQRRNLPIDHRADLYAVGLILHELFTLRTPMDEPVEVPQVRNDVSPALLAVLKKAVTEDRESRWQSAKEFRDNLTEAFEKSYRPVQIPGAASSSHGEVSTEGMVYLEGGSFLMGSNDAPEEGPQFEAFVEPFYIDETPVTVGQYAEYVKATGATVPKFWNHPDFSGSEQPVVGVSWHEANAYAAWAGKQLPTEMQWEFAARGKENRTYPWGHIEPDPTRCNFRDYLGMPSIVTMHEEGMTPDNIKDMAGNVYEWVVDPFVPYSIKDQAPDRSPLRVVRGGCWHSAANELRCTFRKGLFPEAQLDTVGFRCVLGARPEMSS